MILHYELGNIDLSESLARSINRSLSKNKEGAMNKIIAKALLKIIQRPKNDQTNLWQQLLLDLKTCDSQTNGLEELVFWLEKKL